MMILFILYSLLGIFICYILITGIIKFFAKRKLKKIMKQHGIILSDDVAEYYKKRIF
jgi:hypothetical protein